MEVSTRTRDAQGRKARAERILDATAELLLRWGYRRVTIDDVAAQANIGKGTIYLHWPTREALFYAVLLRESLAIIDEIIAAIRQDPEISLLHRFVRTQFSAVMRRPLIRAVFTGDLHVLGKLVRNGNQSVLAAKRLASDAYLRVLQEHGLLRGDLPVDELTYALSCSLGGFYVMEPVVSTMEFQLTLERKADVVSSTIRRAFEPPTPPPPDLVRTVAPHVIDILTEAADRYREQLRQAYE
jgi:AcrR family transcriptional regulator